MCSAGKFLTTPLLLFALAAVIHVYLRMTLICYTMVNRILDLIDNLAYSRPRKCSTYESNALLLQRICYDTDKLPDGMPASLHASINNGFDYCRITLRKLR